MKMKKKKRKKKEKEKRSQLCGGSQEVCEKTKWRSKKFDIVFVEPISAQRLYS